MVIDGPFAETKEQLLGLYVVNCADEDAAIGVARDLRRVNPSAVYEIRPIRLYLPGEALPETASRGSGLRFVGDRNGLTAAGRRSASPAHAQPRYQPFEHDVLSSPLGRDGARESSWGRLASKGNKSEFVDTTGRQRRLVDRVLRELASSLPLAVALFSV